MVFQWLGTAYLFDLDSFIYFKRCIKSYTDLNTSSDTYGRLGEAVYNVYTVPKQFIRNQLDDENGQPNIGDPNRFIFYGQEFPIVLDYEVGKPQYITEAGYRPRNNKLLTYPYCYFVLSNNNGTSNILHYENFTTDTCKFKVKGVPVVGGSIKCIPNFYGDDEVTEFNEEEGVVCGKFPALNWSQNEYYNWLLQNGTNVRATAYGGAFATGLGLALTIGGALTGQAGLILPRSYYDYSRSYCCFRKYDYRL